MTASARCLALFITAPASGQGKTTVTAALARYLLRQGKVVRVFKTGPDYLDPQILQQASGQPVVQLDLWMAGENWCRQQLFNAACNADVILIEGAMGMFDGNPCSADLAACFGIPMVVVLDVKGMAQTAAAIATGLAQYRSDISIAGLIANNCGTERHRQLIADALPTSLPLLAALPASARVALPERHLGLVQPEELGQSLERCLEAGADWLTTAIAPRHIANLAAVEFLSSPAATVKPWLAANTIAVARDAAFSFIYQANLQILTQMGATVRFFSPLYDSVIPAADALWLPGGYPELYAQALADNQPMLEAVRAFFHTDKPILAECGGFMYCLTSLQQRDGDEFTMAGLLAGKSVMRDRGGCQGLQVAPLPEGELTAHAHHRSISELSTAPLVTGRRPHHPAPGEAIYRRKGLTASYLHLFFPSNPEAIARVFRGHTGVDTDAALLTTGGQ